MAVAASDGANRTRKRARRHAGVHVHEEGHAIAAVVEARSRRMPKRRELWS